MLDDTVVALRQPGNVEDPLTDLLREGARQLLAQAIEAEVADMLSAHDHLRSEDGRRRLVRHGSVRLHRAPPRAPPDRAFRCHGEPDDGVGRTADPRGIPVGHGAAVPDPRPGRRIRAIVPLDRDGEGRGRGRHGATEPVAKSVCGTPDRQREARMPGPFDHPQRAAFAAHSWLIPRLLSRFKDPPVDRQGHTGWTTRSAGRVRNGRFPAQGRRSVSSLRTPRGLTTPARIRSIPLCGDVDAAGIRMPLHRFAGTIRRNKHRDDRAHGRLQNPLAQNDVRAGEPSRRWEARWNKWKGQANRDQIARVTTI